MESLFLDIENTTRCSPQQPALADPALAGQLDKISRGPCQAG